MLCVTPLILVKFLLFQFCRHILDKETKRCSACFAKASEKESIFTFTYIYIYALPAMIIITMGLPEDAAEED